MIKNETIVTKKDIEYISKIFLNKNKPIKIYRIFVFIFGICTLLIAVNEINIYSKFLFIILGLILFYFSAIGIRKKYTLNIIKKSKIDIPRTIQIDENKIDIEIKDTNMHIKTAMNFEIVNNYYENENNIYILINNLTFLVINNEGYTKGNKEELIKILEKNNIKKGK